MLYLYFRFTNNEITDYNDTIINIYSAFYEILTKNGSISNSSVNGSVKPFKIVRVGKKSIERYNFLKKLYINFIK